MSLETVVTARIKSEHLVQLSRFREDTDDGVDTSWTALIAADALGVFSLDVGRAWDETLPQDRAAAVPLFLFLAHESGLGPAHKATDAHRSAWERHATRLRDSLGGSNDRIGPSTSSELTPSTEVPAGSTVRPWADGEAFNYTKTQPPRGDRGSRFSDSTFET